jgi:hypothetical protein
MTFFLPGLGVWAALLVCGYFAGAPLIIGFFASLPFGATAFAALPSLGGSSPLIYVLFALAIIAAVALRRSVLADLGRAFAVYPAAWLVCALALYAAVSSYIFPRLFAERTIAFVPVEGVVTEVQLGPTGGNITQTAYFLLGALLFLALIVSLERREVLGKMARGFFAFVIVHVLLGFVDFAGKLAGAGDVLEPIRTASYALLTETEQSGFWRIVGGCPEASSFAAFGMAALAFAYTWWREAGSWLALLLTVSMLVLLILSTSSTAYVGVTALSLLALVAIGRSALNDRLKPQDITLATGVSVLLAAMFGAFLYDPRLFAPFTEMIDTMVFDKAVSSSGQERAYWNMRSLQSFLDTYGMGVGMGSSRSSSWAVSILAQLGLAGGLMVAALLALLVRGMGRLRPMPGEVPLFALCSGARACAIGYLLAGSIAGGTADPGVLFFASLATVLACRRHALASRRVAAPLRQTSLLPRPMGAAHAMSRP